MKVGDKVVCIVDKSDWSIVRANPLFPVKGEIYTIRNLSCCPNGKPGLTLMELPADMGFGAEGFRPLLPIDLWLEDEQEAYLERLEKVMPGVEPVEIEK